MATTNLRASTTRSPTREAGHGQMFAPTSWTAILHASDPDSPKARDALSQLCGTYWGPLHAYARRLGHAEEEAKDLTQEFFVQLLRQNLFGAANRKKGKFRSFLLTAFNHFLADQRRKAGAAKRGGGQAAVSLDETDEDGQPLHEAVTELSPVKLFERRWALAVYQQAFARTREDYAAAGKTELFEQLKSFLEGATHQGSYGAVAAQLKMTANAVGVAVHRLRERFGKLVREEVARTLADPTEKEIEAEMRHLFTTLSQ